MTTLDAAPGYATRGGVALAPAPDRRPAPPRPAAPIRRHLRVVGPSERVRRRLTPAAGVLLTAALFALLLLIAISHTLLVQNQVKLDGIDQQLVEEQARYQSLRRQVAEMESPERIVAAAQELGMVTPDDLVYLQPDAPAASSDATDDADAGISTDGSLGPDQTWSVMKPLLEAPAP